MKTCYFAHWKQPAFLTHCLIICLTSCMSVFAQSQDRDNPTPLTTNEIRGKGITRNVYYYKFIAGPGELTLTVDGKTDNYSRAFEVELFTTDAKRLGAVMIYADRAGQRKVARVYLQDRTTVIMRLVQTPSTVPPEWFEYLVRLEGALHLQEVTGGAKPKTTANRSGTKTKHRVVSKSRAARKPSTGQPSQPHGPRAAIGRP
jgi:hypothetical protein